MRRARFRLSSLPGTKGPTMEYKVWVSNMNYERAAASIDETLRKLGTDYVDLMLLHQAMGDYPGAYRAMEDALKAGKIRAIGVSNFYPERLVDVCALAEIPPAVNQVETHPFRQQDAAHAVMERYGVAHESWAPFAEAKNGIFENPVLREIGEKHGKTIGQLDVRKRHHVSILAIKQNGHFAMTVITPETCLPARGHAGVRVAGGPVLPAHLRPLRCRSGRLDARRFGERTAVGRRHAVLVRAWKRVRVATSVLSAHAASVGKQGVSCGHRIVLSPKARRDRAAVRL